MFFVTLGEAVGSKGILEGIDEEETEVAWGSLGNLSKMQELNGTHRFHGETGLPGKNIFKEG